jgi:hypothetical protein
VLANGSYGGFSVSRSGQSGKPIVIRSANLHGAKIGGRITIAGDHVWIVGMDMSNNNIVVTGSDDRVTRNHFRGANEALKVTESARRAEVDHNEIDGAGISATGAMVGMRLTPPTNTGNNVNHYAHHNYFHDNDGSDNNGYYDGSSTGRLSLNTGIVVEYNLWEDWKGGGCTHTKAGGQTIRFNTCVGGAEDMVIRTGQNNKIIANWVENARNGIRVYDEGNQIIGNRVIGSEIGIRSGSIANSSQMQPGNAGYIAATDTLVAGNTGNLRVGYNFSSYDSVPARDTRIEAHDGSVSLGRHTGTTQSNSTSHTIPKAFKLSPSQVGPNAPTAPR